MLIMFDWDLSICERKSVSSSWSMKAIVADSNKIK